MDGEHLAAIEWTRIAEPGDQIATALIGELGYEEGLACLSELNVDSERSRQNIDRVLGSAHSPAVTASLSRWAHRLSQLAPFAHEYLSKRDLTILTPHDPLWPGECFQALENPPFALWIRGNAHALASRSLAVVGSRACSSYGEKIARDLVYELAGRYTVVSGGAFGIDLAAHQGALLAGGQTIIVSAGGADRAYPKAHESLFDQVVHAGGAVVSESPLGAAPQRHRFLSRNRLIAALAMATVVVEAPHRSGALSTARHALAMGRPVGGVPGPVDSPMSQGVHELLRNGGTLVCDADDVIELAGWDQISIDGLVHEDFFTPAPDDRDPVEERVWEAVPLRRSVSTSAIAAVAGLTVSEAQAKLGKLALSNRVERTEAGWKRLAG